VPFPFREQLMSFNDEKSSGKGTTSVVPSALENSAASAAEVRCFIQRHDFWRINPQ
jgi:hypothetical protein